MSRFPHPVLGATPFKEYAPNNNVDVIVVGAGLSGLKAGYEVQQSGLSCLIIEARDRVGGKTWSVDPLGKGFGVDVGAAWINDTTQAKVYELTRFLGLETVYQNTKGNVLQEDLGMGLCSFPYGSVPEVCRVSAHRSRAVASLIYMLTFAPEAR